MRVGTRTDRGEASMREQLQSDLGRFELPMWDAPYDIDAEIAAAPEQGTVRGMFFDFVIDKVRATTGQRIDDTARVAFGKYPVREYMRLLARGAQVLYPNVSRREGLRRMGHTLFDEFYETMIGRAIFSVAGRSLERICSLAPKAYDVSYEPVSVQTHLRGVKHAHIIFSPMFIFPETFHVGAWEGAARFCGNEATVRLKRIRTACFEYELRWR
jgi:uncharacterized protein (TIGR02265 family)